MVTEVSPEQPGKIHSGIEVTLSPIIRDEMLVQFSKASVPLVHFSALNVTEVSPEQPLKAYLPIDVTELGMVTEVSPEQPLKAISPIDVTEFGMDTEVSPEQ